MNPAIGQILQVVLSFLLPDGGVMQNVFYYTILNLASSDWDDIASDLAIHAGDIYDAWMDEVSNEVTGLEQVISVRDVGASQWNAVNVSTIGSISGTSVGDSGSSTVTGTAVSYPTEPRHWGFKNFPPAAEGNTVSGQLTSLALAALLFTAVVWSLPFAGNFGGYSVGVYSLATETFREFVGSVSASTVQGTRVTRKTGRGI